MYTYSKLRLVLMFHRSKVAPDHNAVYSQTSSVTRRAQVPAPRSCCQTHTGKHLSWRLSSNASVRKRIANTRTSVARKVAPSIRTALALQPWENQLNGDRTLERRSSRRPLRVMEVPVEGEYPIYIFLHFTILLFYYDFKTYAHINTHTAYSR